MGSISNAIALSKFLQIRFGSNVCYTSKQDFFFKVYYKSISMCLYATRIDRHKLSG